MRKGKDLNVSGAVGQICLISKSIFKQSIGSELRSLAKIAISWMFYPLVPINSRPAIVKLCGLVTKFMVSVLFRSGNKNEFTGCCGM